MEPDEVVTITVSKAALADFWSDQEATYDCLGPAADDVLEGVAEAYPRATEVYDALRKASK